MDMRHVQERGFTLIELLVVTAILTLITGIMLASNTRFGGTVLLENLAYDVAISIREAQVYGISVRRFSSDNFEVGYGVRFSISSPTSYSLFGDADNDGLWSAGEDISPSPFSIGGGYYIDKLCAPAGADSESCTSIDQLDIVFLRPDPDAFISANGISGILDPSDLKESARIVLKSPRDDETSVVVEVAGQIFVQ